MCDPGRGEGVEIIAMAIHIKTAQEGPEFDDWGQKYHQRLEENGLLCIFLLLFFSLDVIVTAL